MLSRRVGPALMSDHRVTLLLAASAVILAGCGRTSETTQTPMQSSMPPGGKPAASAFRVALVMSGPTTDNGWNAGAFRSLQAIRKELNVSEADSPYVENAKSPGEQEEHLRAFARQGFPMVVGHGNEYESLALKLEKEYPRTLFVISSGGKVGTHTMPIVLQLEDGAYLEGMLAAGMSRTGKIGAVGAMKIPPLIRVFDAYKRGAESVNPKVTVIEPTYTGSWDDPARAKAQTQALLDQGADIVLQDVDAAAKGVFQAVQERNRPDHPVYALGTNSDQNGDAPDVILASAPIYTDKAIVSIARQVRDGAFKASDKPFSMQGGFIDFVLNPKLMSRIPADLKAKLQATQRGLQNGSFTVPRGGS